MKWRAALLAFVALAAGLPLAGAAGAAGPATTCVRPAITARPATAGPERYISAIDAAAQRGLEVWIEADLAKRWMEGDASFTIGVRRIAELASRPGVVGIKIADELGYRDWYQSRPTCVLAFLHDAARALRAAAPRRRLLVDFIVPALGCIPGVTRVASASAGCRAAARSAYPALTLQAMDQVMASKYLDAVDLSTGLLDPATYQSWGTSAGAAQRSAWQEVVRRRWQRDVQLNSRKALAHSGTYAGDATTAESDAQLFVDVPSSVGAKAVDIWTWRQLYKGDIYRLMNPGLAPNPLWSALQKRHDHGVVLMTHFSPSSIEVSVDADLDAIARVFGSVFVAAGVG